MTFPHTRARLGRLAAAGIGAAIAALLVAPAAHADDTRPVAAAITTSANRKAPTPEASQLNVLAFNVWHGGTQVPDGAEEIAEIIRQTDADVTFLTEGGDAPTQVAALLGYQHYTTADTGVVSRYPIVRTDIIDRYWSKAVVDVNGTEVVVYGGHLEYRWYATYLPRGYGGEVLGDWPEGWDTWNQLDEPVTDVDAILAANAQSGRPATAAALLADVQEERAAGRLAIVGGDFNEPSNLDWTAATADLFDHNGVVLPWQTTKTLLDGGLVDAYREVYPDPVANPGVTWPSDNALFPTTDLTWAPAADERDRIDYIFATPDRRLSIDAASVVGPQSTIVRNERVVDNRADEIFTPDSVWPSDHRAVLAAFTICAAGCDESAPAWDASMTYSAGDEVSVGGSIWRASWWTRNQHPGNPYGPWQEIIDHEGIAEWTPSRIFYAGDVATHNGRTYVAQWWSRNDAPAANHGPWRVQD